MSDDPVVERIAQALRKECLAIFGSTWNNDNSDRLALAALAEVEKIGNELILHCITEGLPKH